MQIDAVRRITIEAKTVGAEQSAAALGRLSAAQRDVASSSAVAGDAASSYEAALAKQLRQIDIGTEQIKQAAAAQKTAKEEFSNWGISGPGDGAGGNEGLTFWMQETAAGAEASGAALIRWGRVLAVTGGIAAAGAVSYMALSGQIATLGDYAKTGGDKLAAFGTWLAALDNKTIVAAAGVAALSAAFLVHHAQADEAANDNVKLGQSFNNVGSGVESSVTNMVLFGGAIAVVTGALTLLHKATDDLIKLGDRAQDSRLGVDLLLALEQAAVAARVSVTELNSAIDHFTKVSKKAPDDAKEFYKALSNIDDGLSDAFKSAPTQEARLKIIADGLSQATTEVQRYQLAEQAFGVTNDRFISVFVGGASAIDGYIAKAAALGVVIDDAFIKKAQAAQAEMATLTTFLTQYLSIKAVEAAQAVKDLALSFTNADGAGKGMVDSIAGWMPTFSGMRAVLADLAYDFGLLAAAWDKIRNAPSLGAVATAGKDLAQGLGVNETTEQKINRQFAVMGKTAAEEFFKGLDSVNSSGNAVAEALVPPTLSKAVMDKVVAAMSKAMLAEKAFEPQPSLKDDDKDAWDRFVDQINKADAAQRANVQTVGLAAGAHEKLKIQLQGESILERDGVDDTEARRKALEKLAEQAGKTAQALAAAHVANKIDFGQQTAFLGPQDVQIAQALVPIYGNDIPRAMASSEAAAMRTTDAFKSLSSALSNAFTSFITDLASGKSGMDALIAAAGQLGKSMTDIGSKSLIGSLSSGLSGKGFNFDPGSLAMGAVGAAISFWQAAEQKRKAAEEKQAQAWAAWNAAAEQLRVFIASSNGKAPGSVQTAIVGNTQQGEQLKTLREAALGPLAAGFDQTLKDIDDAEKAFAKRTVDEFKQSFGQTIALLNEGFGPSSDFGSALAAIKSTGDQLNDTIANTLFVFGEGSVEMKAAQQATQAYALSLLQVAPALSATQSALQKLHGQATGLQDVLVQLGMSADDAAKAISSGVTAALHQLAASFTTDLQRQLNDASGKSYLNDIADKIAAHQSNLADSAALGLSPDLANAVFKAQVQQIIDGTDLIGSSFDALIAQFPELSGVASASAKALQDQADAAAKAAADQVAAAKAAADAMTKFTDSIKEFRDSLLTGDLSTLGPLDKVKAAQAQFNADVAKALTGDADAQGRIQQEAQTLLTSARDVYASSAAYASVFNDTLSKLDQLSAMTPAAPMASGGLVTGGIPGMDSVPALLMPGELVIPAAQVSRFADGGIAGVTGGSFSGISANDNRRNFADLARSNMAGFAMLRDEVRELRAAVLMAGKMQADETRRRSVRPAMPGKKNAA